MCVEMTTTLDFSDRLNFSLHIYSYRRLTFHTDANEVHVEICFTFGMVLANRRSSSLCESFPFTTNFPKGVRSITPTFSITSLYSLPAAPNQLVRRKLGLNTTQNRLCFKLYQLFFVLASLYNAKLMGKHT